MGSCGARFCGECRQYRTSSEVGDTKRCRRHPRKARKGFAMPEEQAVLQELEEFLLIHGGNSPLINADGVDEEGDLPDYVEAVLWASQA